MAYHVAVCRQGRYGREGFVISAETEQSAIKQAEGARGLIGFVGCGPFFRQALVRACGMERNERGAWGPLDIHE